METPPNGHGASNIDFLRDHQHLIENKGEYLFIKVATWFTTPKSGACKPDFRK